ncbi:MAG: lipoyl(octanoyl) transferase LipB [Chthoniobacterales bacterium]
MSLRIEWLGKVDYDEGLAMQTCLLEKVFSDEEPETLLLLEHHPIFTIGRTRDESSLKNIDALPHPLRQTNRGGQATYHGPGQLVGYPILNLRHRAMDLHRYLRFLESVLLEALEEYGLPARRSDGLTGIWIENRKIASIGVGVRKWITMHGFALNVTKESLPAFDQIIPCGIDGVTMTSVETELGKPISFKEVSESVSRRFEKLLTEQMPHQSDEG